jgi:hypothetical protein
MFATNRKSHTPVFRHITKFGGWGGGVRDPITLHFNLHYLKAVFEI